MYHVTHFEASENVILHTRYVRTCVGADCGRGREQRTKATRCGACYYSIVLNAHRVTSVADIVVMCIGYISLTCDMYKSSLRHIHDPVLLSLKMKGIRLLFFFFQIFGFVGRASKLITPCVEYYVVRYLDSSHFRSLLF
jgi:hypothetical protein